MANILERYGIKEVADMTFYHIASTGKPDYPVLYLDTLKVSTIEQTAEQSEARGGKGNPPLIIWDYGKEITVTLEDALFSAKSMAIMFGNGQVKTYGSNAAPEFIMKTETFTSASLEGGEVPSDTTTADANPGDKIAGWEVFFTAPDGKVYKKQNPKFFDAQGNVVAKTAAEATGSTPKKVAWTAGERYFCSYDLAAIGAVIEISANSFPGTYYAVGDTYARSEITGEDEFFQFIIPKAKVQSENTITLEAEGDPSVFNMSLRVMRPADGAMMKLVKYNLFEGDTLEATPTATLDHNHYLNVIDEDAATAKPVVG